MFYKYIKYFEVEDMDGRGSYGFLNYYFYQGGFKISILKGKHMEGGSGG